MDGDQLWAFGDESVRRTDSGLVYIMAATMIPYGLHERTRERLLRGQHRLHWRDESPERRRLVAKLIAGVDATSILVIGTGMDARRQERARRLVLETLLWDLGRWQVSRLVLESRNPALDRRDLQVLDGFRKAGTLPRGLTVKSGWPRQEPLLWIPDAICGAVGERRCHQHENFDLVEQRVDIQELSLN